MSGPWERYQAAPKAGPWTRYATPQAKALADARAYQQRSTSGPLGGLQSAADQIMRGRTLGFSGDIAGGIEAARTGLRNLVGQGPGYGMADAYHATRQVLSDADRAYAQSHPLASMALQLVGGLKAPGMKLANQYVSGASSLPRTIARSGLIGSGYGALSGFGNARDGQREGGALQGGATGGVVGMLVPGGFSAAGHAGDMVAAMGGNLKRAMGFADPAAVATRRLATAMASDVKAGANPHATLSSWPGNSSPTLADVGGENLRSTVRNAGTQGPARQTLAQYQKKVAADLQDNAIGLANRLTPGDARTAPAIIQDAQQRVAAASTPPAGIQPGQGGAALSQALNERATSAKAMVDQAYQAARAAEPDRAQLPASFLPQISAGVRDAVSDFSPQDVPRVTRALGDLDSLSSPNVRDLFDVRSRLTNLRASNDPVEAKAAGLATRALDGHIDQAHADNQFTGDPAVVALWRNAIGQRRAFGQQFEGEDLIHALTSQEKYGAGRTVAVAPEDASNAILGRNGVSARPNLTRDFGRITDLLGADHPAVTAIQREAADRLLQPGAGTARFGDGLLNFARVNPELSNVLLPSGVLDAVHGARQTIADATADSGAVSAGQGVLGAPDQYASDLGNFPSRLPMAQIGARQRLIDTIGAPTEGATGALNRMSSNTNTGRNLEATFGPDAASAFTQGIGAEADRASNANWMAPQLGAKTFTSAQDAGHGLIHGVAGLIGGLFQKVARGPELSDAERSAIVDPAVGQLTPELLNSLLASVRVRGPVPTGSGYLAGPLAAMAGANAGQ